MTLRGFGEDDTPEEAAAREALERVLREHAAVFAPHVDEDGDCVDPTDDDVEDAQPMPSPMLESYVLLTSWQSLEHSDMGGVTFSCSRGMTRSQAVGILIVSADARRGIAF